MDLPTTCDEDAIVLFEKATKKLESSYGPNDPDTLYSMQNLAELYEKTGRLDSAGRLLREIVRRLKKTGFRGPAYAAEFEVRLGRNLLMRRKPAAAEKVLREARATYDKLKVGSSWPLLALSLLGEALLEQHHDDDAGPLLLQGYEGLRQHGDRQQAEWKPRLIEAGERVVRYYEATNQLENARAWREKLAAP